jgi:hypothetical protein
LSAEHGLLRVARGRDLVAAVELRWTCSLNSPSIGGLLHIMPLVVKVCQIAPFLPLCQTPHTNWLPLKDQNLLDSCPQSIMMD